MHRAKIQALILLCFVSASWFLAAAASRATGNSLQYKEFSSLQDMVNYTNALPTSQKLGAQFGCEYRQGGNHPMTYYVVHHTRLTQENDVQTDWDWRRGFSGDPDRAINFANSMNTLAVQLLSCWNPNVYPASTMPSIFFIPDSTNLPNQNELFISQTTFATEVDAIAFANTLPVALRSGAKFIPPFNGAIQTVSTWRVTWLADPAAGQLDGTWSAETLDAQNKPFSARTAELTANALQTASPKYLLFDFESAYSTGPRTLGSHTILFIFKGN